MADPKQDGDHGEELFERFVKELGIDSPISSCTRVERSIEQGVKTPDFHITLRGGHTQIDVEIKTIFPTRSERDYRAGIEKTIDCMKYVERIRKRIEDANRQFRNRQAPGILVLVDGPDVGVRDHWNAVDMAMKGNHVAHVQLGTPGTAAAVKIVDWSRDGKSSRTGLDLNDRISAIAVLFEKFGPVASKEEVEQELRERVQEEKGFTYKKIDDGYEYSYTCGENAWVVDGHISCAEPGLYLMGWHNQHAQYPLDPSFRHERIRLEVTEDNALKG